jgi:hypothetical protein
VSNLVQPRVTRRNVISVSKIVNVPLPFVYNWCTDYRPDDSKLTGSKTRRVILNTTSQQVIYLEMFRRNGKLMSAVNIVSLRAPTRWHLDYVGQDADETGEYRLTRKGPKKTKLEMHFNVKYKIPGAPTKSEDIKQTNRVWDQYIKALESDYSTRNQRKSR